MKVLNKQEKNDLKSLTEHRGYKLLEELINDFEFTVLQQLKTINLADKEALKLLNAKQNYLLGIESMLRTIKTQTNSIGKKDFN